MCWALGQAQISIWWRLSSIHQLLEGKGPTVAQAIKEKEGKRC